MMTSYCFGLLIGLFIFTSIKAEKVIFCYYGAEAIYRPPGGKVEASDLNASLCSHFVYSYAGVSADGGIIIRDGYLDADARGFKSFCKLKNDKTKIKLLVSIGEWQHDAFNFSKVANNPHFLNNFVHNVEHLIKSNDLDGVNINWEYITSADKVALIRLLKSLRELFNKYSFILTVSVRGEQKQREKFYDAVSLSKYVNYIILMAYNFHTHKNGQTGHNAPLYPSTRDNMVNIETIVKDWIKAGSNSQHLVLGMGFFGRSFTLKNTSNHDVGAPTIGAGLPGKLLKHPGVLSYTEICSTLRNGWIHNWDKEQQVPYAHKGNQWISYDNVLSIELKCSIIEKYNLAGGMVSTSDLDDVFDQCGAGKFPLLSTIKRKLGSETMIFKVTNHLSTTLHTPFPGIHQIAVKRFEPSTKERVNTKIVKKTKPRNEFTCTKVGFVRSPTRCGVFYYCSPNKTYTVFHCPTGQYYDEKARACNFSTNVKC